MTITYSSMIVDDEDDTESRGFVAGRADCPAAILPSWSSFNENSLSVQYRLFRIVPVQQKDQSSGSNRILCNYSIYVAFERHFRRLAACNYNNFLTTCFHYFRPVVSCCHRKKRFFRRNSLHSALLDASDTP
jgi:hypothetical protein